ncbi:hypothetical protein HanXRQr2_Chr16g0764661 [Helianthus annuus]|uniref:Uncharacterized protein n=1 Tax=Helianthus annuus TaxID=4232 RepID=A0A9K3DTZ2_HELAN|nr:hypothetical protein HanXRQr2_Chr16g0764661 [Helianthus annuus]KAJ0642036.1 hypothetical protein HanLR1_Chr16g0633891 [Helianthus annuus]
MKLTSRFLGEHEVHILERTKGICYEVSSSEDVEIPDEVLQSEVQGTSGGDVEIHLEKPKQKTVIGSETVSEPASSSKKRKNVVVITSDDSPVQSSDETAPNTHVDEAPVSPAGNKRRRGKQIVFTDESSSDHYEVGQTSADQEYVPKSVPEVVTRWYDRKAKTEVCLRDRISRYRLKMTCQHQKIWKLKKKVRKLKKSSQSDNRRETIQMLEKNTHEHAKVVEALTKELEEARDMQEKLKQERATAAHEKDSWTQERYVIKKLHGSREFLESLGAMESNLWSSGAHVGLVEGYANCKAGVALEHNRLYMPKAERGLINAADKLKHMQYPYVVALAKCRDCTLDELKALEPDAGMEDEGAGCSKKARKAV